MLSCGKPKGSQNEAVKETLEQRKITLNEAQTNLECAQCRMVNTVNRSRRRDQYKIGNEVVLSTAHFRSYCSHLPKKLRDRWVGPFTISRVVLLVAYKVDLPPAWQIHPSFHIDRLKWDVRLEEFLWELEPPPPILVEDHLGHEAEDLIQDRGRGAPREFLVLYKGCSFSEATSEYDPDLKNAPDTLEAYLRHCGEWTKEAH